MKISDSIKYVGVNDHRIDLFEGQYKVPNGMAYNSYVIMDEKIAVMDTVDAAFTDEWLNNIRNAICDRQPDYLIVQHMEPDHSANILKFTEVYPTAKIVSSKIAFVMMKKYFEDDFSEKQVIVKNGDKLSLGSHELAFVDAPMVHWPEVIMTYEMTEKVLFSADAFGKFGANDVSQPWEDEARRYYFGIVGKYGDQVQKLIAKVADLKIEKICPLHGPVLDSNLEYYLKLYNTWSSYDAQEDGIVLAYTSCYGNTKKAVDMLLAKLLEKGKKAVCYDLARSDMSAVVGEAFRYSTIVLATTTYNAGIFPFMRDFIDHLTERNFQKRKVAFIENGSWAPLAEKVMHSKLEQCKNLEFANNSVKIHSAVSQDNIDQINALAEELGDK